MFESIVSPFLLSHLGVTWFVVLCILLRFAGFFAFLGRCARSAFAALRSPVVDSLYLSFELLHEYPEFDLRMRIYNPSSRPLVIHRVSISPRNDRSSPALFCTPGVPSLPNRLPYTDFSISIPPQQSQFVFLPFFHPQYLPDAPAPVAAAIQRNIDFFSFLSNRYKSDSVSVPLNTKDEPLSFVSVPSADPLRIVVSLYTSRRVFHLPAVVFFNYSNKSGSPIKS